MFNDITDEDWNEMLGTNLNSAFFAIQEYNETRNGELAILQAESRQNAS